MQASVRAQGLSLHVERKSHGQSKKVGKPMGNGWILHVEWSEIAYAIGRGAVESVVRRLCLWLFEEAHFDANR